jgi:hypothetical protein
MAELGNRNTNSDPPMEPPIIISLLLPVVGVSGLFVVKRIVRSKDVVSVPSVQDILITYSEAVLTSILEFCQYKNDINTASWCSNPMKVSEQVYVC